MLFPTSPRGRRIERLPDPASPATPPPENPVAASSAGGDIGQAVIDTPLGSREVVEKLRAMSQRGKLPGFEAKGDDFLALAYGWVYDFDLLGTCRPTDTGTRVGFALQVKRKVPWIVAAVLVLSVFPGVWITDSMLVTYFDWYPREFWKTCAWYLPLSIIPVPWIWKTAMHRSRAAAEESARELIGKIAAELGANAG